MKFILKILLIIFIGNLVTKSALAETQVYGDYNRGCIIGSVPLPEYGIGFQSTRRSRGLYFGHPNTIRVIENIGTKIFAEDLGLILIGNLSKPNGGALFEHSISHQNGLDFDISYQLAKKPLSDVMSANFEFKSLLSFDKNSLNKKLWDEKIAEVLKITAEHSEVERILIDPLIKKQLCETEKHEDWFKKLRPWFKHDNHFHVRLKCPADSKTCVSQDPPPNEIGCDGVAYEWWFSEEAKLMRDGKLAKPAKTTPPAPYPKECQEILK